MRYKIKINGLSPIIHHDRATGLDTEHPANIEKQSITDGSRGKKTKSDNLRLRQLECQLGLWLDSERKPTIPAAAIRSVIENGARKLKQGPSVREGLVVESMDCFDYDRSKYGTTMEELQNKCQFTVPVVVMGRAILRTRPKFDLPWSAVFVLDCDDELVDQSKLESWLDIAGRRMGLGDWRPQKSGQFGRFEVGSIEVLK